jgi:type IV pilus assembly protein PilX
MSRDKNQYGFVLFVALIALVAMSLAAAALIRSVDTSVLVAGNLAFKQSATLDADTSAEIASSFIQNKSIPFTADVPSMGYYSSATKDVNASNYLDLDNAATWANGKSLLITDIVTSAGFNGNKSISGNSVRYVIQRMCRASGPDSTASNDCILGLAGVSKGSISSLCNDNGRCPPPQSANSVVYRVTSRVVGPKNTVSYTQAYIY